MTETVKRHYPEDLVGSGELFVLATDYDRLEQERDRLQIENEALASGLRGKHSLVGATCARMTEQRDAALKQAEGLRALLETIKRHDIACCMTRPMREAIDAALSAKP